MKSKTHEELLDEVDALRRQLEEANDTIDAIRTGQIDALVVHGTKGHQLFTLKTADQTYRLFIEKMTEGAVTLDKNGIILYSNTQFAKTVGLPLPQVIGLPFNSFICPDFIEQFRQLFTKGWLEDCKAEIGLNCPERYKEFLLSCTSLDLDEGEALSIILTDLTEQKDIQKQLQQNNAELGKINKALEISNQDLQQFAFVASHDLQEPLRKIQLFSSIIKNKYSNNLPDQAVAYLEKVIVSSERMKTLIVNTLLFSRLEGNRDIFVMTDFSLLMKELVRDFEILIEEKDAKVLISNLPHAEVNPHQMRQVFHNLLHNALKFSQAGTKPNITILGQRLSGISVDSPPADNGDYVCISIEDNGIGFDEKYLETVFTIFKRLHSQSEYEGTGIGLAIAKRIIEKHHGSITATSTEGVGSKFTIVLPIRQAL